METTRKGIVVFYNVGRMYGFIQDKQTDKDYFCHNSSLIDHIKKGDNVTYVLKDNERGAVATQVKQDLTATKSKDDGTNNNNNDK